MEHLSRILDSRASQKALMSMRSQAVRQKEFVQRLIDSVGAASNVPRDTRIPMTTMLRYRSPPVCRSISLARRH